MVEIMNREVFKNRIQYLVLCADGKERIVDISLNNPNANYKAPRVSTWSNIWKNGKRYGASSHVSDNRKIWGDGFLARITADLDAEFPGGYQN